MTIKITGEIGLQGPDQINFDTVSAQLDAHESDVVDVYVNSTGGDAPHCVGIQQLLEMAPKRVHVTIGAIAAGGAAWIALIGHRVSIHEHGCLELSLPQSTFDDLGTRRLSEELTNDIIEAIGAALVIRGVPLSRERLHEMLQRETWLMATEALKAGLVDDIIAAKACSMSSTYDLSDPTAFDEHIAAALSDEFTTFTPNGDGTFRAEGRINHPRMLIRPDEIKLGSDVELEPLAFALEDVVEGYGVLRLVGRTVRDAS